MFKQFTYAFILAESAALHAFPSDSTVQQAMIQDIEAVKYHMSIQYAPKEWKYEHLGWTLEGAADAAKQTIVEQNHQTSKDFQQVFNHFMNSTQDYHVHPIFYSTEWAFFPLSARKAGDKYYLHQDFSFSLSEEDLFFLVDEDASNVIEECGAALSNIRSGDELIAIDGIPASQLIEKFIDDNLGGNRTPTGYALAEKSLFFKMAKYGHKVPEGSFKLTVRHQGISFPKTYRLKWIYVPESIMNKAYAKGEPGGNLPGALLERYMKKDFTVHYAEELLSPFKALRNKGTLSTEWEDEDEPEDLREKGALPLLGEVLWESSLENSIFAYLYRNDKGDKIGYIYLPSFSYAADGADFMMDEIIDILKYFSLEKASALVLDITNNPGGNLFYTYGVLSTLTKTPLAVPINREILIQEDVFRAQLLYKILECHEDELHLNELTLSGYPFNQELLDKIKNYCQKIVKSWEEGKTFTDPIYLFGIDKVMPHPEVQFDKPILVLINELDFSCADFFPAVLQDNGRATLFGKRTAGAGGYVRGFQHSSRFGVMGYTLTGSIAFRADGNPIENLGVQPDVPYELTVKDMTDNCSDYIKAVNSQVKLLTK